MKKAVWNIDKKVGQKPPLSTEQVQSVKLCLSNKGNVRDIALFSLAIDSSLRGVDLISLRVSDLTRGGEMLKRPTITQNKTEGDVSFHLTPYTLVALEELIQSENKGDFDYVFTSQRKGKKAGTPLSPGHYRRLVKTWLENANINSKKYSSHSLRRTKLAHIYSQTGNIRAVQILGGHASITNTTLYLGVEREDALDLAEKYNIL